VGGTSSAARPSGEEYRRHFVQILIVDDSKAMRSIVMRALRQAGFENVSFREAANGKEALQAIHDAIPDLVLADWNMPEMSGIELLQALRAEGSKVKFGFITSESDASVRELATQSGALFLITKPFPPEAVKAALLPVMS
jgi:two-component system chemotaxis response regulator CheY